MQVFTNGKIINIPATKKRILVAPLEWGLGHATRCIPIINELLTQECEVMIASEGATSALLREEFPLLKFLPLMGYRVKYSRKKIFLPWKMLTQFPKMLFTIYREHQWLKNAIKQYSIDAIISDNRFGLYSNKIPSIYITHQLLIKTGNGFTEKMAQKIHYRFINKYGECWVPDFKEDGLGGELSHPQNIPGNTKYIGCLSRFEIENNSEKKYDLLISISGPEPQRTIFERQLLNDLKKYKGTVLFIRGLPDNNAVLNNTKNIEFKNHLSGKKLNTAVLQSDMIISRCGYTTVMDMVKLNKKAILVPTPGQTEQEYLSKYLKENKMFFTLQQNEFSLEEALKQAASFSFKLQLYNMNEYKTTIAQFVHSLQTRNFAPQ